MIVYLVGMPGSGKSTVGREVLVEVSRHDPSVVACGGGVVLEPANRIALRNTGTCVYLDVPLDVLEGRVSPAAERPLIRAEGDLERLLAEREGLYREFAAHVVDGSGPPGEVADATLEKFGGDSLPETRGNLDRYLEALP